MPIACIVKKYHRPIIILILSLKYSYHCFDSSYSKNTTVQKKPKTRV